MAIAALNAEALMITDQLAEYEFARMVIDQEREALASKQAEVYENYTLEYQRITIDSPDEESELTEEAKKQVDQLQTEAWQQLYAEYQAQTAQLDNQDKKLEMERTRLDTKIESLETYKESADKRLQSNIEKDMKGIQ